MYNKENTNLDHLLELINEFIDCYTPDDLEQEWLLSIKELISEGATIEDLEREYPEFWDTLNSITDGYAPDNL